MSRAGSILWSPAQPGATAATKRPEARKARKGEADLAVSRWRLGSADGVTAARPLSDVPQITGRVSGMEEGPREWIGNDIVVSTQKKTIARNDRYQGVMICPLKK